MHTETADGFCAALTHTAAFKECFEREGYVVVRAALPPAVCAEAVDGFLKEVHLDARALFLRDARARYAPHAYTDTGRMRFPIVNLQDISGRRYRQFKAAGLALLTDPMLRHAVEALLGEPAWLARTMYSDGNQSRGRTTSAMTPPSSAPESLLRTAILALAATRRRRCKWATCCCGRPRRSAAAGRPPSRPMRSARSSVSTSAARTARGSAAS